MPIRFDVEELIRQILRASALPLAASAVIACGSTPPSRPDAGDAGECSHSCCGFVSTPYYVRMDGGGRFDASDPMLPPLAPDGSLIDGGPRYHPCPYCQSSYCSEVVMRSSGEPGYECQTICYGRLTDGATLSTAEPFDEASYLARMAEGEALSVHSFRRLERELRRHAAPAALVQRARAAARDEIRHARGVRRLLGRREPSAPHRRVSAPSREFAEVIIENAVRGCVEEAFGALLGAYQAQAATNSAFRKLMIGIACDEAHHAQLAFDIHHALAPRLSDGERTKLRRVVSGALDALEHEGSALPEANSLGVPDASAARRLATEFRRSVSTTLVG